jgi:DNA excision repair protein ERCC-5
LLRVCLCPADLHAPLPLRLTHRERFGWDAAKIEDLLRPVLASYGERSTQLRIDQFLSHKQRFAKIRSKRLQHAVTAMVASTGAEVNPELFEAATEDAAPDAAARQGADADINDDGGDDDDALLLRLLDEEEHARSRDTPGDGATAAAAAAGAPGSSSRKRAGGSTRAAAGGSKKQRGGARGRGRRGG